MRPCDVHIIGAGLAGLSAAVDLAATNARLFIHEAAKAAGGRCRSYHDQRLGMEIDNGNHLLLSANRHALHYVATIGAAHRLTRSPEARFPFVDLETARRWTFRPSKGPLPLWAFTRGADATGAHLADGFDLLKLMMASTDVPLAEVIGCGRPLYRNLIHPLLLATLNTDPAKASSALARQLIRDTLAKGAQACQPIIMADGLSTTFVDPALHYMKGRGAHIRLAQPLRALSFENLRATALHFDDETITLSATDLVILAVPPQQAATLVPGITTPDRFNAIVNAHFATAPPPHVSPFTGITGATTEWLFSYQNRLSVTISAANHLLDQPSEKMARTIWNEVATITGLQQSLPPWRLVREKRATFEATPEQNRRRPATQSDYENIFLAGDWTNTGLPATIEGAIKSGVTAADHARRRMRAFADEPSNPTFASGRKTHANANHGS